MSSKSLSKQVSAATLRARKAKSKAISAAANYAKALKEADRLKALGTKKRNPVTPALLRNAREWYGSEAPASVVNAKARCLAWRAFAKHSEADKIRHQRDISLCEKYERQRAKSRGELIGPDPFGDE